jgi:hypothetical protein
MSIEGVIREEASYIASREHKRAANLNEEYLALQAQADDHKAKRDAARAAPERLLSFQAKSDGDYQCPACWIERNAQALLAPKASATKDDIFECVKCGHETIITY